MRAVKVYKSLKRVDMYLYLDAQGQLEDLPEALRKLFGRAKEVMDLELTPDRSLARASAAAVLDQIEARGFYLQMPPEYADLLK
ncbi:MAG: YcgL domain-containing protein [Proteobacteria bacterium]|nr:YcgL domain-containing protein [Pseudomonadota bacterium]